MDRCPNCGWPMVGKTCQHCQCEDYDNAEFMKFSSPILIDKTLNTLTGILTGISIDSQLNQKEIDELYQWCLIHSAFAAKLPYSELFSAIFDAIDDNKLVLEEKDNLLWLINRLRSEGAYFNKVTTSLQILHGILHGIIADGKITKEELQGLKNWLANNKELSTYYPFDEVCSLVVSVLQDEKVSVEEERLLSAFFSQFAENMKLCTLDTTNDMVKLCKNGICATAPVIEIKGHEFCFTGKSSKATRSELADFIIEHGGLFHNGVTKATNYLIVGDEGNPCWSFSCYGRKVEKAIEMRKKGGHIMIVSEFDFWDTLA